MSRRIHSLTRKQRFVFVCIIGICVTLVTQAFAYATQNPTRVRLTRCSMTSSKYLISAKPQLATSGEHQVWVKVRTSHPSTIRVQIDQSTCIEQNLPSTNGQWKFVKIQDPTSSLRAGTHTITVAASHSDLYWSTLWIFPYSSSCIPNIDTVNVSCTGTRPAMTRMYASGATQTFGATPTPTTSPVTTRPATTSTTRPPINTTRPTTTVRSTVPVTTQPTTTTFAPNNSCFANSIGVVSHPVTLSTSGTQRIWVRISTTKSTTLNFSLDNIGCISQGIHSMGSNEWMWMAIDTLSPVVQSGNHIISIGSSSSGVKLSHLLIFNSSINCQPTGDGSNCPPTHTSTTKQTSVTTSAPTTTRPITTTTMSHTIPSGSPEDNVALERFRNTDSKYMMYSNLRSDQIPLAQLTKKVSPSSSVFHPEITGRFRTQCDFSHLAYDDPIMKPNQPGKSHLHMFYGNTGTNGNSTADSIVNSGGSTCSGGVANRTAYWFPTVHDAQGRVRIPNGMVVYYKTEGVAKPAGGYADIPQGLKLIAGNASATAPQGNAYNHGFGCGNMFINPNSSLIPNCNSSTGMMVKVHFPRCWDGSFEFDPSQPQKHVAYEVNGRCPASNPIVFTGITVLFDWDLAPGETTAGWYLSSDRMPGMADKPGGTTLHGDWFNGWNKEIMTAWNQNCSNASFDCSLDYLGNNNKLSGVANGGVNQLVQNGNKQDSKGPIALSIPPRKNS